MKLKELSPVLYSTIGNIQFAIVYDKSENKDIESGCSVDYAVKHYAESDVKQIQADNNYLVIVI